MFLKQWIDLRKQEKKMLVEQLVRLGRNEVSWIDGFESYIVKPESLALVDKFIAATIQYRATHNHYGAKAIIEHLRWHSFAKDADVQFKINNTYTTDITRLVKMMFPGELDSFFQSRVQRRVAA